MKKKTKYRIEYSNWDGCYHLEYESKNFWGRKRWYRIPVYCIYLPTFSGRERPHIFRHSFFRDYVGCIESTICSKDKTYKIDLCPIFRELKTLHDFVNRFPCISDYYDGCVAELQKEKAEWEQRFNEYAEQHKTIYL